MRAAEKDINCMLGILLAPFDVQLEMDDERCQKSRGVHGSARASGKTAVDRASVKNNNLFVNLDRFI